MSFILDALRKADQQRQRGAAPTLLSVQQMPVARKQPAFLAYGLLAVILIGIGLAIGWLRPWQGDRAASPTPERVAARPLEPALPAPAPASSGTAPQPGPEPVPPAAAAPSGVAPQPAPPQPDAAVSPAQPATAASANAPRPKPAQPARARIEKEVPQADAPAPTPMAELPLPVRQSLPPMAISFHAYSAKPEDRLVGINNNILREGDDVAPGLKLEAITPDGMVFDYQGHRFHRGVK